MTCVSPEAILHAVQPRVNLRFAMADWFKFFNDTLDDPKFQYAISEHQQVTSVFLLILSEASKNRNSSIPWRDQDFELFGFARKINVTVPILNECLNLLTRIGYINKDGSSITVMAWDSMQSDYCRGIRKGYYVDSTKKLASNSEVSTPRGEERRGEKRGSGRKTRAFKKGTPLPGEACFLKTGEMPQEFQ